MTALRFVRTSGDMSDVCQSVNFLFLLFDMVVLSLGWSPCSPVFRGPRNRFQFAASVQEMEEHHRQVQAYSRATSISNFCVTINII